MNEKVVPAQIEAITKWVAQREGSYDYLKSIRQPTLVVNGSADVIIYPVNSFILQQNFHELCSSSFTPNPTTARTTSTPSCSCSTRPSFSMGS